MTLDEFLNSLGGVESGGDPTVTNKDSGAQGTFQIMPANWPSWAKEAGVNPNDRSAAAQRAVAAHKAQQYHDQFGSWEAVAVAWYAGPGAAQQWVKNPNDPRWTRRQDEGKYPSVNSYVQKVMGGASPTANVQPQTFSTTTTTPDVKEHLPADATPEQITAYIQKNYPEAAPFLGNDEIRAILLKPGISEMDDTEVTNLLRGTQYWQTHGPESRAFDSLIASDPKAAEQLVGRAMQTISDGFSQQGITATETQIGDAAKLAIRAGWINSAGLAADAQALGHFSAFVLGQQQHNLDGSLPAGAASVTADQLRAIAQSYMVPMTEADLAQRALDITAGKSTAAQFTSELAAHSKSLFTNAPDIQRAIDEGRTPTQYFAPIKAQIADILELTPDQVDFNSPRFQQVISTYDPAIKGNRPMTLGEAGQWARDQEAYTNTHAYKDATADTALRLKAFIEGRAA